MTYWWLINSEWKSHQVDVQHHSECFQSFLSHFFYGQRGIWQGRQVYKSKKEKKFMTLETITGQTAA